MEVIFGGVFTDQFSLQPYITHRSPLYLAEQGISETTLMHFLYTPCRQLSPQLDVKGEGTTN